MRTEKGIRLGVKFARIPVPIWVPGNRSEVNMTIKEGSGLALSALGFVLIPVGLVVHFALWAVAFLAASIGLWLYWVARSERVQAASRPLGPTRHDASDLSEGVYHMPGWHPEGRPKAFDSFVDD